MNVGGGLVEVTWATSNNHERVDVFHGCLLSIEP